MPETMTKEKNTPNLTEQDVIEWLKAHPKFFLKRPDVLDILEPPKAVSGKGIADFQSHMIKRLKDDREDVIESAREIVETSRANMNNLSRIQTAILMLLEARNFEDFVHTLTMDFVAILDVDIVALIVETDGTSIPHINMSGVRAVPAGTIELLMKKQKIILESQITGLDEIYGGGAGLVKSQALLDLNIAPDAPAAMIAFGSRNPDLFQNGQGTDLVLFLGHVIERCFLTWLDV